MTRPIGTAVAQAGAIALRNQPTVAVLLVRSRADVPEWIFPKGHVEAGETTEQTALRELREEAGIVGRALAFVGRSHFQTTERDYTVDYFLVREDGAAQTHEPREQRWCSPAEALELLTFADAKALLGRAMELLRPLAQRDPTLPSV